MTMDFRVTYPAVWSKEWDEEVNYWIGVILERAMGFEPTTTCLGSKDSTTELRPPLATGNSNPTLALVLSQGN